MAFLQCTIQGSGTRGNDEGCDDGVRNCNVDLLPADDAIAEPPCHQRISSRDGFGWVGGAEIGDGGSHFVWSGDDSSAAVIRGAANEVMAREAAEAPADAINNPA
jgi:hypothetical protein